MIDIAKRLGKFTCELDFNTVPEDIQDKVKTCFMNSIGVGIAGYELEPATHARNVAKAFDTKEDGCTATLLMDGSKLSIPGAAFANTVLFHSRAQEDTLGGCHNGTMIAPAVLALAENFECTGKEIFEAVLAGYEVTSVIEKKMSKLATPRGFRPSAIFVIFGVAAASSRIMRLTAEQTADAIRIAASFAGGIQQSFAAGTTEWFYQNGCACRNGLLAALLARDGVVGAESAFDGVKGFMNVMCGDNDYELVREKLEVLGKEYGIKDVTFKFNPCCQIAQTPFLAACDLANEVNPDPDEIAEIRYHMNSFDSNYPGTKRKGPFTTSTQTTMSAAFNISNAIVNRKCTKKGQMVFDNPVINGLAEKVTIVDDDDYPILAGKIEITMKDGTKYENEMMIDASYYSLTWDEHKDMMYRIHEEVGFPKEKTDRILDIVEHLTETDNIRGLINEIARP